MLQHTTTRSSMRCGHRAAAGAGAAVPPLRLRRHLVAVAAAAADQAAADAPAAATADIPALKDAPLMPLPESVPQVPAQPGVYAVYDAEGAVQYVGLSRRLAASVAGHSADLPDLAKGVRLAPVPAGTREALTAAWKLWVEQAVEEGGRVPPGNAPGGGAQWQGQARKGAPGAGGGGGAAGNNNANRPEIRLTAGKAIDVPLESLISQVVKDHPVVAFVKGTRREPQCGFSARLIAALDESVPRGDYQVLNVLDEFHNPGLREAVKQYSQWPTIPQLYVGGEFVGGADIVEGMRGSGELHKAVAEAVAAKNDK
jgi:Grx4 family monothiol glutaredoxin